MNVATPILNASRTRRQFAGGVGALASLIAFPAGAATPVDGAPTLGDPYFPALGNSGYKVQHYQIALAIDPRRRHVEGVATIDLTPSVDLRSWTFDFVGLKTGSVDVAGVRARFDQRGKKLRVFPGEPLAAGQPVRVVVRYAGKPTTSSPQTGWIWAGEGGALICEPDGAATLFPCNDHPSNKATFSFDLQTKPGYRAIANGLPSPGDSRRGITRWIEPAPFPTYAAVVAVGKFRIKRQRGRGGLTVLNAFPVRDAGKLAPRFARQDEIIQVFGDRFGPYEYAGAGSIVTRQPPQDPMESAGRPIFPNVEKTLRNPDFGQLLAHEYAHQWFGNAVTLNSWNDIWLNEGFATFAELYWVSHATGRPLGSLFERGSGVFGYFPAMDQVPPGAPGKANLFSTSVYNRGALTLEALRRAVGDDVFWQVLTTWVRQHRGGNVTTPEFVALAQTTSGRNLDRFFQEWLYQKRMPPLPRE